MEAIQIIKEIQRLSLDKKFQVVEETIKSIKKEENHTQMEKAAHLLFEDYTFDSELTAFTSLDLQDFYETK